MENKTIEYVIRPKDRKSVFSRAIKKFNDEYNKYLLEGWVKIRGPETVVEEDYALRTVVYLKFPGDTK